jgi:hypothetical protein
VKKTSSSHVCVESCHPYTNASLGHSPFGGGWGCDLVQLKMAAVTATQLEAKMAQVC